MQDFPIYSIIIEEYENRITENSEFDKMIFYSKFRKPISKEHSILIGLIIIHFMEINNNQEYKDILNIPPPKKSTVKKYEGMYENKIFNNKRVYCGRTLGEMHEMSSFPEKLLRILDIYYDIYMDIKNE